MIIHCQYHPYFPIVSTEWAWLGNFNFSSKFFFFLTYGCQQLILKASVGVDMGADRGEGFISRTYQTYNLSAV